ncbi:MAG: hypothetical protein KIG68_04175 [Oxalobacter sp.]|nr:hypothetical protein [Oxalobacter sp.]
MVGRVVYSPCMKCFDKYIENNSFPDFSFYENLMSESGVIHFECKMGHKNAILIQEKSFEILLELAIENLVDKYYREAIFNFASAQERCFEFFIELISLDNDVNDEFYENMWKRIFKSSSERQLGAFYFLYLMRFKKSFSYDDKKTRIRNNVIHRGNIATKEMAFEYGEYVLNNIYDIVQSVTENINIDVLDKFVSKSMMKRKSEIKTDEFVSTMSGSIISWQVATDEELERENKLLEYSRKKPDEYSKMANKANGFGNKVLDVNNEGELILIDAPSNNLKKGAKYRGRTSLGELINNFTKMRDAYKANIKR